MLISFGWARLACRFLILELHVARSGRPEKATRWRVSAYPFLDGPQARLRCSWAARRRHRFNPTAYHLFYITDPIVVAVIAPRPPSDAHRAARTCILAYLEMRSSVARARTFRAARPSDRRSQAILGKMAIMRNRAGWATPSRTPARRWGFLHSAGKCRVTLSISITKDACLVADEVLLRHGAVCWYSSISPNRDVFCHRRRDIIPK